MTTPVLFNRPAPRLLYPALVTAAVCITVFSLVGIASMTGYLPQAHAEGEAGKATSIAPSKQVAATDCGNCGVVESVRAIEVKGSGSGTGAVIGGIAGALLGNGMGQGNGRTAMTLIGGAGGAYAGNEIEKNSGRHTVWQTRVRFDNGNSRTYTSRSQPGVDIGSKVRVVDGQVMLLQS
ncbi:MAG: glycine zipper 2TM domain-containing protein [Proteobacteria bacterium]|nr:glycine zipper 2TM domain-containing protein [Pseudomonadota bacterium]HQR03124.1 glycine zipper 2TM domain-containing protein [Rhodocyclaceae bacterium]